MFSLKSYKVLLLTALVFLNVGSCFGAPAGEITLEDLNGQSHALSSYTGKPVILFFWTTWCPSCRSELNDLAQRSSDIAKEGIVLLGVDAGEPAYKVQRYLKGRQFDFPILLDQEMDLVDKYDLFGVPTFVFINKEGRMVAKSHRLLPNYKDVLSRSLDR